MNLSVQLPSSFHLSNGHTISACFVGVGEDKEELVVKYAQC